MAKWAPPMSGRSDATLKVLVWRRTDERTSVGPTLISTESINKLELQRSAKNLQILLSRTQVGPGREGKQKH